MQTLVAYVENKPGVLNCVSSLARRLAINIDSLTVGPTENEAIARMTIVAHTDEKGRIASRPALKTSRCTPCRECFRSRAAERDPR
jgi:acetolactate synthase small subunit